MKLTRERKIYAGLLALGILGLAVDRMTSTPQEAKADDAAALVASPPTGRPKGPAIAKKGVTRVAAGGLQGISHRLRAAAAANGLPDKSSVDVFRPSRAWAGEVMAEVPAPKAMDEVARFKAVHRLTAVLVNGRKSRAIIDGKALLLGEVLEGFRLISVDHQRAMLQSEAGRMVLALDAASDQ
jgi:hypothetical protein